MKKPKKSIADLRTQYPSKILIAWSEAINGNRKIREWLMRNGYKELGVFTYALNNKEDARQWLFKHEPHLMALINGAEGKDDAIEWLQKYGFTTLAYMARAGDGYEEAFQWLLDQRLRDLYIVAKRIKQVKFDIEDDHNDPHKLSVD